ncbi:hypothetical protein ACWCWD_06210 [Streptomyces sp. NPDC001493]
MTFPRYCVDCDRTIASNAIVVSEGHSASGAREDAYAHPAGDPACTVRRASPSMLHQQLDAMPAPAPRPGPRR